MTLPTFKLPCFIARSFFLGNAQALKHFLVVLFAWLGSRTHIAPPSSCLTVGWTSNGVQVSLCTLLSSTVGHLLLLQVMQLLVSEQLPLFCATQRRDKDQSANCMVRYSIVWYGMVCSVKTTTTLLCFSKTGHLLPNCTADHSVISTFLSPHCTSSSLVIIHTNALCVGVRIVLSTQPHICT